ncbi:MAG TPA: aldehyde dehydrogenase family protein, partial [Burkholderiales bacterium]|nr:aldehyde dehydrogenase family protein [Burkholderiales bacterium]
MNKPLERSALQIKDIPHWIDGRETPGASGRHGDVYDPALGRVSGRVGYASAEEVSRAVASAQAAFAGWAATPPLRRARVLFKFKELIERNLDALARVISSEHGKVVSDARGEATRGLEVVEFACGIPQLLK